MRVSYVVRNPYGVIRSTHALDFDTIYEILKHGGKEVWDEVWRQVNADDLHGSLQNRLRYTIGTCLVIFFNAGDEVRVDWSDNTYLYFDQNQQDKLFNLLGWC